jgi:hypothetical protein
LHQLRDRAAVTVGHQPDAREAKRRTYLRSDDLRSPGVGEYARLEKPGFYGPNSRSSRSTSTGLAELSDDGRLRLWW